MKTPPLLRLASAAIAAIAAIAAPAFAQDAAGSLRIQGNVMVSTGGGAFASATNGQPVVAGQRIMVGDDASATITYAAGCKRSYSSEGVYTVDTSPCSKDDKRQNQGSEDSANAGAGTEVASEGGSTLTSVGIILGTALLGAAALDSMGEVPPDNPVSH